jgi:hypothetical protein
VIERCRMTGAKQRGPLSLWSLALIPGYIDQNTAEVVATEMGRRTVEI